MEKVSGIGGVFFRAKDPEALRRWYEANLGIPASEFGHLFEENGLTVWNAFPTETTYFGTPREFMVNYRVSNLEAMLAQLRENGVAVDENVEAHEYGRFGWATDPEGNRFELWEPPAE